MQVEGRVLHGAGRILLHLEGHIQAERLMMPRPSLRGLEVRELELLHASFNLNYISREQNLLLF